MDDEPFRLDPAVRRALRRQALALALLEQRQALVDTLEMILHERRAFHAAWHAIRPTLGPVTLRIWGGEVVIGQATLRDDEVPDGPFFVVGFGDDALVLPADALRGEEDDDD